MKLHFNVTLISAYQELIKLECKKIEQDPEYGSALTENEIEKLCKKYNLHLSDFINSGLVIEVDKNKYRTIHGDLIYRVVNTRAFENSAYRVCDYHIEVHDEGYMPNFNDHPITANTLNLLVKPKVNSSILEVFLRGLQDAGISGLSHYQYVAVSEIFHSNFRVYGVVAPTATGKTLIFMIPILINLITSSPLNRKKFRSIILYPRRALSRNQLRRFINILFHINEKLKTLGIKPICIGADYGDIPRRGVAGSSYLGLQCPKPNCSGELKIYQRFNSSIARCEHCGSVYDWIFTDKETIWRKVPDIYVSNIWTLYRRILDKPIINLFKNLKYVVLDEAHVYTYYLGGHIHHILKLLYYFILRHAEAKFIISSATIPRPINFISELLGVSEDEVKILDYHSISAEYYDERTRPKKLSILVFLLPNPNYSVETVTEDSILMATLWCWRHGYVGITFTDSIAEINTLYDYITSTILGSREAREVLDHIYFNGSIRPYLYSYSWSTLIPTNLLKNVSEVRKWLMEEFRSSIGTHYGLLSQEVRFNRENAFLEGQTKMLIATSTLELGVDIGNAAVIVQHKLPREPESLVQRIGRAGRSEQCLYTSLGFIVLQQTPIASLYLYNETLRRKMLDLEEHPGLRVSKNSLHLKIQHAISALLSYRANIGKNNYVISRLVKGRRDLRILADDLIPSLRKSLKDPNVNELLRKIAEPLSVDELKKQVDKVLRSIERILKGALEYEKQPFEFSLDRLKDLLNEAIAISRELSDVYAKLKSISYNELISEIINSAQFDQIIVQILGEVDVRHLIVEAFNEVIEDSMKSYKSLMDCVGKLIDDYVNLILDINRCYWEYSIADQIFNSTLLMIFLKSLENNIIPRLQNIGFMRLFSYLSNKLNLKLKDLALNEQLRLMIVVRLRNMLYDNKTLKNVDDLSSKLVDKARKFADKVLEIIQQCIALCEELSISNVNIRRIFEFYQINQRRRFLSSMLKHEIENKITMGGITSLDVFELASRVLGDFFFSQMLEEPSHKIVLRREAY